MASMNYYEENEPVAIDYIESIFNSINPCTDHYANFYFYYKWGKEALYHVRRFVILPLEMFAAHPSYIAKLGAFASLIFKIEFHSRDNSKNY